MAVALRMIVVSACMWSVPATALALEPLSRYLAAGRTASAEARESDATVATRAAETRAVRSELLPSLEASAGYTRNQYDIVVQIPRGDGTFDEASITPRDQLEATLRLSVPLLDLGAIRRAQAARRTEEAASRDRSTTLRDLEDRIAAAYTKLIAYEALSQSSARAVETANANLEVVRARAAGGLASDADVRRAVAQVASAEQAVADAGLERRSAARELEATTGLAVTAPIPVLDDDLHAEAPLESWIGGVDAAPLVVSARARMRAADATAKASRAVFLPKLSAHASERLTNAAGFGEIAQWAVGVSLTARFDVQSIHRARAERAAVGANEARYDLARRTERLSIEDAHDRVESLRARARAARAEAQASDAALAVAQARYEGGTAAQLEVVQSLRDAFAAEASRIQADSELVYARVRLRLVAGKRVEDRR